MTTTPSLDQLLAHLAGDYLFQTHHQATQKTAHSAPAAIHAATYTAAFLPLTRDPIALLLIGSTHFLIDRYRLARYVNWAKNQLAPVQFRAPFPHAATDTGFPPAAPDWLATWLLIITDNLIHLTINRAALKYFTRAAAPTSS
jgi:hypothetical protein